MMDQVQTGGVMGDEAGENENSQYDGETEEETFGEDGATSRDVDLTGMLTSTLNLLRMCDPFFQKIEASIIFSPLQKTYSSL